MNKIKMQNWIIALLLATNLGTIGGILYHHQEQKDKTALVLDSENNTKLTGKYFKQVLGFNRNQMDAFRTANRKFQPVANQIIHNLDSLKQAQYKELKSTFPDTVQLNELSDMIGLQHATLKKVTNRYFLELKAICDDEQVLILEEVFHPLFKNTLPVGKQKYHNRNDKIN